MNDTQGHLAGRAAVLRAEFDRSFALPHIVDKARRENLLAIHIGRDAFALRLSEISGMFSDRRITPVPSSVAALIGVVGFRGTILPVYSLQAFFGQPQTEQPRWLVIAAAAPVALAFQHFDGHAQVLPEDLLPRDDHHQAKRFVRDFARLQGLGQQESGQPGPAQQMTVQQTMTRPIAHVPSIVDAIRAQSTVTIPLKER